MKPSKNFRPTKRTRLLAALVAIMGTVGEAHAAKALDEAVEEAPLYEGILIDRFMVRDLRPAEGAKIRLSFALYAEVEPENASAVHQLMKISKHRIRSEVLVAIRTCEQHDFQEPGLERFRRRILVRLRRTIPELKAKAFLIGEFEFFNE